MNRFYGNVGFIINKKVAPGVYEPDETTRPYYGDILTHRSRFNQPTDTTNSDLKITNTISIVADAFSIENVGYMRWVEYSNSKWSIESVEVKYPRIELTLGGVYNG